MNQITDAKLEKYFDVTKRALDKVKVKGVIKYGQIRNLRGDGRDNISYKASAEDTEPGKKKSDTKHSKDCLCTKCSADVIFDMAWRYFSDAKHFKEKGDIVTAFAALNYAHGWLDAGARLGFFDVTDNILFTVD